MNYFRIQDKPSSDNQWWKTEAEKTKDLNDVTPYRSMSGLNGYNKYNRCMGSAHVSKSCEFMVCSDWNFQVTVTMNVIDGNDIRHSAVVRPDHSIADINVKVLHTKDFRWEETGFNTDTIMNSNEMLSVIKIVMMNADAWEVSDDDARKKLKEILHIRDYRWSDENMSNILDMIIYGTTEFITNFVTANLVTDADGCSSNMIIENTLHNVKRYVFGKIAEMRSNNVFALDKFDPIVESYEKVPQRYGQSIDEFDNMNPFG